MEVGKNTESHLTSVAAFVDGGIQDPCEDTCSICLEEFSESDPASVMSFLDCLRVIGHSFDKHTFAH